MAVSTAGTHPACFPPVQNAGTQVRHPVGMDSGHGPARCGLTIKPKGIRKGQGGRCPTPLVPYTDTMTRRRGREGLGVGTGLCEPPAPTSPLRSHGGWLSWMGGGQTRQSSSWNVGP